MAPGEGSRTLFASAAIALVALGCCVGLPLLGGALAGVTLAAAVGGGGGLLLLIASTGGTVALLRARRARSRRRSGP